MVLSVTILYAQDSGESITATSASLKKLSIEELLNVEVRSVSRRTEKLGQTASAIQVITHEQIRRSGAASLPEALRLATNLRVAQVNSSQWSISARGFNNVLSNKLLVMIDGRTVYTPLYAGVFWDVQNILLEDVERIEVISGPGGTLWGSNAVNGVINIITKSAKDTQGLLAEAGVGNELQTYGGLRYGGKFTDKLHYSAYATAFKRASLKDLEGNDSEDDWTMAQGGLQFNWQPTENDELILQSNVYDTRPNPDGSPTAIKARGQNVLARWVHANSENSDFRIQAYYDRTSRDFRNGFREKLNTYDVDTQHKFEIGNSNEIIWGIGLRIMDHHVDNLELFRFKPGDKTLHLYSIFVQDRITLVSERLDLTLGIKAEHNRYTGMQYQPGARLAFKYYSNQLLWAAVSRAVRIPARIDRDFYLDATPEIPLIAGNNNFKSEGLLSYELGWRLQLAAANLSVATFYNSYSDLRTAEPGPPPFYVPITFGNGVEGDTYGVELSATYEPADWLQFNGGYTFLTKDLSVKSTSSDLNGGTVESNDPRHQFLIQTMIDPSRNTELSFTTRYVHDLPEPLVAAYWELDARVAWRPYEFMELSIVGQNLLHDKHIEFIPSSPPPRYIERSIYGKVVCRF
jgi:iron complex outermembrane receptor protein